MTKIIGLVAGIAFFTMMPAGYAADHNLTAIDAGGLTDSSQPFQNSFNNPAHFTGDTVPGEGSPLSGEDTETPATDQPNNGKGTDLKPVADGKTAPSQNSAVVP